MAKLKHQDGPLKDQEANGETKPEVNKINELEEPPKIVISPSEKDNQTNLDPQSTRKRRQNVAMSSLINNQQINTTKINQANSLDLNEKNKTNQVQSVSNSNTNINNYIPTMKNSFLSNIQNTQLGLNSNNLGAISSSPSPSLSTSSNSSNNNEHFFLKNNFINTNNNNTMNNFKFLQQQQNMQQMHQNPQQTSFFPSASARQFNQQNPSNVPLFNDMNQMNQQRFNNQGPMMNFNNNNNNQNGFPNFLPHTNFPPNPNELVNTKEKINQLNSKFQLHQQNQHQLYQQAHNIPNQQIGKLLFCLK